MRGGSVPRAGAGPRVGRGMRAHETRDRNSNRLPVETGTTITTDGFEELGDDEENRPSQAEVEHLLENMAIFEVKQMKLTRRM